MGKHLIEIRSAKDLRILLQTQASYEIPAVVLAFNGDSQAVVNVTQEGEDITKCAVYTFNSDNQVLDQVMTFELSANVIYLGRKPICSK